MPATSSLRAVVNYTGRLPPGARHGDYVGFSPHGFSDPRRDAEPSPRLVDRRAPRVVHVRNGRLPSADAGARTDEGHSSNPHCAIRLNSEFSLAQCGFELVSRGATRSADDAAVLRDYIPEVETLVRELCEQYLQRVHPELRMRGVWVWDLARRSSARANEFQEAVGRRSSVSGAR